MNRLPFSLQVRIISLLTEGTSIRATERLTGCHRDTTMRLSARIGDACRRLHHARMRGLQVSCLELDETGHSSTRSNTISRSMIQPSSGMRTSGSRSMPIPS